MTDPLHRRLLAVQAGLIRTADNVAAFWNRLPAEDKNIRPNPVVLAIFASAGGLSIAMAFALIATVPR